MTFNGGVTFTQGTTSGVGGGDRGVVVDRFTDYIWFCGLAAPGNVRVGYKFPGAVSFDNVANPVTGNDKPLLGIGPAPGGILPGRTYVTYISGSSERAWSAFSGNFTNWTVQRIEPFPGAPNNDYRGWGATPVVLSNGRVVTVMRDTSADAGGEYNFNRPVVVYTDDGLDWLPNAAPPVPVGAGVGIVATQVDSLESSVGDTPWHIDRRKCAPAIALNYDTSNVYVAFYARAVRNDTTTGDRNTDIYISRSDDGGVSFPTTPQYLVQLTDQMIGIDPNQITDRGPDQMVPAVAIDDCGAVNVFYYCNRNDPDLTDDIHWLDLYYTRIMGFDTGSPTTVTKRLTPTSFRLMDTSASFLGDYHHFAVAGPTPKPTLYAAYIVNEQVNPNDPGSPWTVQTCFLNKITVTCLSDLNASGAAELEDVTLFETALAAHAPLADLNQDGTADSEDEAAFWNSFNGVPE